MLDQNTDRMWYVIGAVIVGAAIILILNGTMPQIFASVADTFSEKTEDVTEITDGIMPQVHATNLLNVDTITYGIWIDQELGIEQGDNFRLADSYASSDYIPVEPGEKYLFEMQRGTIVHNLRVVYFDAGYNYISGQVSATSSESEFLTVAPSSAAFARISAPFEKFPAPHTHPFAPIDEWWFGKV